MHADIPRIYKFLRKFAKSAPNSSEVSVCSGCLFSTTTRLHSLGKLLRMRPSSIGQCRSLSPNTPGQTSHDLVIVLSFSLSEMDGACRFFQHRRG